MRDPLSFLEHVWLCAEGHEVALDDETAVGLAEEERRVLLWALVC